MTSSISSSSVSRSNDLFPVPAPRQPHRRDAPPSQTSSFSSSSSSRVARGSDSNETPFDQALKSLNTWFLDRTQKRPTVDEINILANGPLDEASDPLSAWSASFFPRSYWDLLELLVKEITSEELKKKSPLHPPSPGCLLRFGLNNRSDLTLLRLERRLREKWTQFDIGSLHASGDDVVEITSLLRNLTELRITDTNVSSEQLQEIAKTHTKITDLTLGDLRRVREDHLEDHITDADLKLMCKHLPHLERLCLDSLKLVTPQGIASIATDCPKIKELSLLFMKLDDEGFKRILDAYPPLESLKISRSSEELTDSSAFALARKGSQLKHLSFTDFVQLTDNGATEIVRECNKLENLSFINSTRLTNRTLEAIASEAQTDVDAPPSNKAQLQQLNSLYLWGCYGMSGGPEFSSLCKCKELRSLGIPRCRTTVTGVPLKPPFTEQDLKKLAERSNIRVVIKDPNVVPAVDLLSDAT